jgi:glucose-1-phosphate cytidylyltransferase
MGDAAIPTVILCGGRGTRISDVNPLVPKPMLPIGNRPVLWHVMKLYAAHGHTDFVLALGWLGDVIRDFFLHFDARLSDFTLEIGKPDSIQFLDPIPETGWRVTCIDRDRRAPAGPVR